MKKCNMKGKNIVLIGILICSLIPSIYMLSQNLEFSNLNLFSTFPVSGSEEEGFRTNDTLLYCRQGSFGPSFENISFTSVEYGESMNYSISYNSSFIFMPSMFEISEYNVSLEGNYWESWDIFNELPFILPNSDLSLNKTEIESHLLNIGPFEPNADINFAFTESSINASGTSFGEYFTFYIEFDLEFGAMIELSYQNTTISDAWVLIDSSQDIEMLGNDSIFNVQKGQTWKFSSNLTETGNWQEYEIKYYGSSYFENQTHHFAIAKSIMYFDYEFSSWDWQFVSNWAENSSFALSDNYFIPYFSNLTALEPYIYELEDVDLVSYNIESFKIILEYDDMGMLRNDTFEFSTIGDCIVSNLRASEETDYIYDILIDSSSYPEDSRFSEIAIYPGEDIYYLERRSSPLDDILNIQFRKFEIISIFVYGDCLGYLGNIYEGNDLHNLSLIEENRLIGVISSDYLSGDSPQFLDPTNIASLDNLGIGITVYSTDYIILHPQSQSFRDYEDEIKNTLITDDISDYSYMDLTYDSIFTKFETNDGNLHDLFVKSQFGLINYWYYTTYSENSMGERVIEYESEFTLYAIDDIYSTNDYLDTTEWGINIADEIIWADSTSLQPEPSLELMQIYDVHLMPSGFYLLFGAQYDWNSTGNEWMPKNPLFNLGNNLSLPLDIIGIFGDGLYPCHYSTAIRPVSMFRDWENAYISLINIYLKMEGDFNISADFYYDNDEISIIFRDSTTLNKTRSLDLIYNENGILQDYLDISFDDSGDQLSWERRVLISGPGGTGEIYGNVSGYIPLNLTDNPVFDPSNSSSTDDDATNAFFGEIPPAIYASVGFVALLGSGTTLLVKKKK